MLNKWRRLFHSSRVKLPFGQNVCECVFGVNVPDLNLVVQINSVKQPIHSNSVCLWYMSHCGTSTFDNYFYYRFIVFKDKHSTGIRILCIGWSVINVCWNDFGVLDWDGVMHVWLDHCWRVFRSSLLCCSVRKGILQSPNPGEWEREYRPCVNLHREKWFQLL